MSTDLGGGSEENRNEENQDQGPVTLDELAELLGELMSISPPPEWRPTRPRAMAQSDSTTSRSTQKKLYEQLSGKLHSDIGAIEEALAQKKFGDPLPEPLKAPVKSFNENREAAALAASTEDHLAANGALKKVGEAIEAIKPALEGVPAFELLRQTITRIDSELVSEGYTTHPAQEMLGPRFDNYRQVKHNAEQLLAGVPDKAAAERKLEELNEAKQRFPKAMVAIKRLADKVDAAYKNVEDAHKATLAKVELYEDLVEWQEYLRMKGDVDGLVDAFRNSYTIVNQSAALNACTDTYPPGRAKLDGPAGAKLAAMLEHAKPADLRRQLSELCSAGLSDSVAGIGKVDGGKELLEKAMKQIGSKAETPEDKKLAAALIQGRYGPKIEGEFSAKNLPLLFNVLGKVPESHLRTGLKAIATNEFDDGYTAGDYSQTTKSIRIGKSQSGDDFKSTTL
ncbi:MAG TPA: hypothetical protein PLV92_24500, partial [Pirellulaceae bacterium]|nr:hypothetical protein [Pirellulaceae bacterium]